MAFEVNVVLSVDPEPHAETQAAVMNALEEFLADKLDDVHTLDVLGRPLSYAIEVTGISVRHGYSFNESVYLQEEE